MEEIIQGIKRKCMNSERIKQSLELYELSLDEIEICFIDKPNCCRYVLQHGSEKGEMFSVYVDHQLNIECFHILPDLMKPYIEKEFAERKNHPERYPLIYCGAFHVGSL